MIVGLVGSPWALEAMKTPEDVMGHAVVYIRIYFPGIIVNLVYNMGAGILRAVGDSRRPLYFLIASCFTNIILDVLLVAVLGMGVAGAALATITSQLLSAVLVVLALMKTDDMYKLEWKKVRIDQRMLQRIVAYRYPRGDAVRHVQYIQCYHPGRRQYPGNRQCDCVGHLRQGGRSLLDDDQCPWHIGHHLRGTELRSRPSGPGVRKGAGACMVIGVALTASVGVVLYNGGHLLVELFTTDQQVQAIKYGFAAFHGSYLYYLLAIEILSGTPEGVGDAWMPLIITGHRRVAVRVLWTMFVLA